MAAVRLAVPHPGVPATVVVVPLAAVVEVPAGPVVAVVVVTVVAVELPDEHAANPRPPRQTEASRPITGFLMPFTLPLVDGCRPGRQRTAARRCIGARRRRPAAMFSGREVLRADGIEKVAELS